MKIGFCRYELKAPAMANEGAWRDGDEGEEDDEGWGPPGRGTRERAHVSAVRGAHTRGCARSWAEAKELGRLG